jgi:hypothetical protein
MTKTLIPILLIILLPFSSFAEESRKDRHPPVSGITNAKWQDYKNMYGNSPLCSKDEITLWTCNTPKRIYSLCSSETFSKTSGYIQYRASKAGHLIFVFPESKKPPFGVFLFDSSANGDASLSFSNGKYTYNLYDSLRGPSSIFVTSNSPQDKETEISCDNANQTLQINYTMRLMYESEIW